AFLVDSEGTLLFYNEAAEKLLGLRFEEAGQMAQGEWGTQFRPRIPGGAEVPVDELPLAIALGRGRPGHARLEITGADGQDHQIEVSALPIHGAGSQAGAFAIFWPVSGERA
ncbi:MAG: PAS domain-containing protein, partial [Actinomycetota bacterium]|nr:PAS domain-containing protein [Actinomycetota bacterium]